MATVVGTDNADWLIGTGNADTLRGFGGNDVLKGGGGADTLFGGSGIDTAVYADSSASVYIDLTMHTASGGTAEGDLLLSIENLQGSSYADMLIGDSAANDLRGLDGDDYVEGGDGADVLDGGYGDDSLMGGSGGDVLTGGAGIDSANYLASPAAVFVSLIGHTALGGDAQGDTLNGIEELVGSVFSDELTGDDGGNFLFGGGGGDDMLKGFGGNDRISGGSGHDVINGGTGLDYLAGSSGPDTFAWWFTDDTGVTAATSDFVADFNFAEGDRIDVSIIDADVYAAGNQGFTFIGAAAFSGTPGEINYVQSGGNTFIQMQTGMSADVEGVICIEGIVTPQASWFML